MNKDLLLEVAKNLRCLADSLSALADDKEMDEAKTEVEAVEEKEDVKAEAEESKYTLEDVRKALAAKSGKGMTEQVKQLLLKHGASKLSAIDPGEYPAIMEEVQSL